MTSSFAAESGRVSIVELRRACTAGDVKCSGVAPLYITALHFPSVRAWLTLNGAQGATLFGNGGTPFLSARLK